MRERFRHTHGDGADLVINELPGPRGSVWALVEDGRMAGRPTTAILCQHVATNDVVVECARRLSLTQGGRVETWQAVVRESLEPSF